MLDSIHAHNNNDENENRETMQKILQEYERNVDLTVESTECTPGSQVGDNYMSVVKRVKIIGKVPNDLYGDTGRMNRDLITKPNRKKKRFQKKFFNQQQLQCPHT